MSPLLPPRWWFLALGLLMACGGTAAENTPPALVISDAVSAVQVVVAANDFEVGQPRIPVIFYDGANQAADIQAVQISVYDTNQEPPPVVWSGSATTYRDYTVPYWVFQPTLDRPGVWGILATATLANGQTAEQRFSIMVEEQPRSLLVGQPAIPSQNRTQATHPDLKLLSSAAEPNPALYQLTVAEALENGLPTVISFTTPAFCQTAICAPVLDSVEAVQAQYDGRANFIHLEIFKEFNPLVTADEVLEWDLPSEPWTFVVGRDGLIRARLGGPVSPQELGEWVELVVSE